MPRITHPATLILPLLLAGALPLALAGPLAAQSYADATAERVAAFGSAVAVAEGTVFVGEGENVMRPGMVYVYRADAQGRWAEATRLTAPDAEAADGFGRALAADGDVLLVGQLQTEGPDAVHVFQRSGQTWRRTGSLATDAPAASNFGASLAVQGGTAVVGAPSHDGNTGRVHVYRRGARRWERAAELSASDGRGGDGFGLAVAVDGDRIVVGALGRSEATGVAYVFRRNEAGQWTEEATLTSERLERRGAFGAAVAVSGDRVLVAAPGHEQVTGAVVEFRRGADGWRETQWLSAPEPEQGGGFGSDVDLRDGFAYVGAGGARRAGAVHVYRAAGGGEWVHHQTITAPVIGRGAGFGSALAFGRDVAVVGAAGEDFGAGAALILTRRGDGWRTARRLESEPESLPAVTGGEVRCADGTASSFDCADVDLLAFLPVHEIGGRRGVRLNDIWGWTDPQTGREYALVGRVNGTSFVDVTDPENPRYLGDLPMTEGSNSAAWRDIKVYRNHAYIVADGAGQHGVQVFDLARLRDVPDAPVTFDEDVIYTGVASSHNIVMDTASGFAFAVGSRMGGETCGGGLHMIDVREPKNPTFAGCFADPQTGRASTGYTHDAQCVTYAGPDSEYRGREICLGSNETALSIADVTDKENPVALARASYPNVGYTHQGWLTEDQRYFFMDDELDELNGLVERTRTLIWDVSDLDDPQLVGEFLGTTSATDHNLYIRGNVMYQSNYQAGLRVIDISDPTSPREVGYFDTVPYGENQPGFGGSWSNYPYFPSGTIVVTSGNEGLFVLRKRGPVS